MHPHLHAQETDLKPVAQKISLSHVAGTGANRFPLFSEGDLRRLRVAGAWLNMVCPIRALQP
jgi:hypothetical protein